MITEVQCWEGDGVEPFYVRQAREAEEALYRKRVERVGKRIADRERREKAKKQREKFKPVIRCERFEMRFSDVGVHFFIRSFEDPRSLIFFAGDRFKEMTFRYPARDDIRYPMRMPVVMKLIGAKVIQMHAVEPLITDAQMDDIDRLTRLYEVSITVKADRVLNESQKVYKAFRDSICLPIQTSKGTHGALPPGQVASSADRDGEDLPQRPGKHRAKGVVREGRAKRRPTAARVRPEAVL